jgi:CRISPR-associated protein (TIGR02710 family)
MQIKKHCYETEGLTMDGETKNGTTASAMIISVGGTPAPIISSIIHYKPVFISFFASQETVDNLSEIRRACSAQSLHFKSQVTLVDDVNDLLHCFEKADEAVKRVINEGFSRDSVIVDYTGGTKNMSVALALASVTRGFSFSYVGGKERTKGGVGVVIDGTEEVYRNFNPWDVFALEEKKTIALLFNQYQFAAAKELCERLSEKARKQRTLFKKIRLAVEGYQKWDLFRHKEAYESFRKARIEEIEEWKDPVFAEFAWKTRSNLPFLERLAQETKRPSKYLILDLFANAERRFEEGKIDDAILRLYRLVEMVAQERLLSQYEINASDVKPDELPLILREEFVRRYRSGEDGKIKLPLNALFELLLSLGDDLGKLFDKNKDQFRKIQYSRNQSYLAHGFNSSKETTYSDLRNFVVDLKIFTEDDLPTFPKIET